MSETGKQCAEANVRTARRTIRMCAAIIHSRRERNIFMIGVFIVASRPLLLFINRAIIEKKSTIARTHRAFSVLKMAAEQFSALRSQTCGY